MRHSFIFTTTLWLSLIYVNESFSQKLIWSDEFETDGLPNPNYWSYDVGDHGWGNNELQFYTKENPKNARIADGILIIEARADSSYQKGYSSARIVTKGQAAWQYAYIEVRAKLPEGTGTWPAIWMLPEKNTYGGWPKSGEIDIMEHVGYDPGRVHGTVHTEAFNHSIGTQKGAQLTVPDFQNDFHTYAIDWRKDKIDFFIDGEKYFTFENTGNGPKEWPFDQPFHLILNIAVGGNWGGAKGVDTAIWPQRLEVDYVRVFDKKP
ncbi:glycoside hydrolase family 16 protein [Algoriphagus litoralis]|uniref:glycoside hydrolase family 16 protein n=1 Tax=Algoriphagus litoralis TaxID=2202829 RepID=UPI000DBA5610|nr:glycoside hydrolase family 16 protein [Algoriphagus litoralis]